MKNIIYAFLTIILISGCVTSTDLTQYSQETASPAILLPPSTNSAVVTTAPCQSVHVELYKQGQAGIAGAFLSRKQLSAFLQRIRADRGIVPIFIWADRRARPKDYAVLISTIESCGFTQCWVVGMATDGTTQAWKKD